MKITARIIIVISVFALGFVLGQQYNSQPAEETVCPNPSLTVVEAEPVQIMIDYGNGKLHTYSMELSQDTSVFDLLEKAAEEKNIELKFKDYGGEMGVFVEAIGGVENDMGANKFWQYWTNNNYAQVGPGQQILKSGDQVDWKFIEGQFNE